MQSFIRICWVWTLIVCAPAHASVSAQTCQAAAKGNDHTAAAACFEELLTRASNRGDLYYQLGLLYRDMGKSREAAARFELAIDAGFRNLGVRFNLISAYFASHQSAAGLENAQQLISEAPKSAEIMLRLGRLLFQHLYYRDALNAFQSASALAPDGFEPRFYLALTHFLLKQYTEAIRVLSQRHFDFTNVEAVNLLAASYAGTRDFAKGSELLQTVIAGNPHSPHAYLNLALMRLEEGRAEDARGLLDQFRRLGPQREAKVFYAVERNSCAELAAEIREDTKVQRSQDMANFYLDLASQVQDRYHFASAVELLRLARRYEGNSERLLRAGGRSCLNLAPQGAEAMWLLMQAAEADPSQPEAWYLLGRAQLRQGDSEKALDALHRAMSIHATGEYALSLGKALANKGSGSEAIAAFEQAVKLAPSNAEAQFELGRALSQSSETDEARLHLMKAIELEPDFYEAYYVLGRICLRHGEREQSEKYLALFERTKRAVMQQSIVGAGYVSEGRRP